MQPYQFQRLIRSWYCKNGRHGLPWRRFPRSLPAGRRAYKILVSEVMLQQTQVSRVLRYYPKFLRAFPGVRALARAPLRRVLAAWQGLGYNRRALYVKRAAEHILRQHGGRIPSDPEALRRLPGIGPATAGAIAAFAFDRRTVFLETNIRRVFLHCFFQDRRAVADAELLKAAKVTLPKRNIREWYWALMDYGALGLKGTENPNRRSALYVRQPTFRGSRREARGKILAAILPRRATTLEKLRRALPAAYSSGALRALMHDGLITVERRRLTVPSR